MDFLTLLRGKNHPLLREDSWIEKPLEMSEIGAAIRCGFRPDPSLSPADNWYSAVPRHMRAYLTAWHIMTETGDMIAQHDYAEKVRARSKKR